MKGEQIQTLHPQAGKTNILSVLSKTEPTHTELMEAIFENLKDTFEGGIQWYGETVKLDLEARAIIERTGSKPEKYRLLKDIKE
jgi:CO dehydrogenase nickel-insertion accessory protein CooC1